MSPGKLAAQVSHASMAFLTNVIKENVTYRIDGVGIVAPSYYNVTLNFDSKLFEEWIMGSFTKVVCGARNKHRLLKAIDMAEELGIPCYPIYDNCNTELEPEECDETTLTCIGFMPGPEEIIDQIGKKYNLL